jgi:hypothetical protein
MPGTRFLQAAGRVERLIRRVKDLDGGMRSIR